MTRFLSIMTVGAALSMTAGLAVAGDTVSAEKILDALKPKPVTRGLSTGPQQPVDTAVQVKEASFVNTLRNRKTRSLSLGERQEIAELAATKPKIDLEIHFDYNSADISKNSVTAGAGTRQGALRCQPEGFDLRGCRSYRCDRRRGV